MNDKKWPTNKIKLLKKNSPKKKRFLYFLLDVEISVIALNKLTNKVDNMAIILIKTAILLSNIERNILFLYKKLYDNYQYHIL